MWVCDNDVCACVCVLKMVCHEDVFGRWCVTKMCVKDCVCDEDVCIKVV